MEKPGQIRLSFPATDRRKTRVARLKSAYLAAFAKFGFRYAFDKRLSAIRQQLVTPHTEVVEFPEFSPPDPDLSRDAILIATKPLSALLVMIAGHAVVLPWLEESWSDVELYRRLAEVPSKGVTFSGAVISWPEKCELTLDFNDQVASHVVSKSQHSGQP